MVEFKLLVIIAVKVGILSTEGVNMIKENSWYYKIRGRRSGTLLKSRSGFKNKEDAETQAKMEASLENIKDYEVETGCEEEEP